jgi:hypothetical protein
MSYPVLCAGILEAVTQVHAAALLVAEHELNRASQGWPDMCKKWHMPPCNL